MILLEEIEIPDIHDLNLRALSLKALPSPGSLATSDLQGILRFADEKLIMPSSPSSINAPAPNMLGFVKVDWGCKRKRQQLHGNRLLYV